MESKKNNLPLVLTGSALFIFAVSYWQRKNLKKLYYNMATKTNREHLESLHPVFKQNFINFYNELEKRGFKPQINSSYRTFKRQAELKAEDKRNAAPGLSKHNYGLAIDIQLKDANGNIYGKTNPALWIKAGIPALAQKYHLIWGGTFTGYIDAVHFEVAGINTANLLANAYRQFKTKNPDLIQGNRVNIV